jgi:hypothetical protein
MRNRFVLLGLLALGLFLMTLVLQPTPVTAATCGPNPTGCGSWTYYGCCSANTKLYQTRTCCNGPTCCSQFRCTTSPCMF